MTLQLDGDALAETIVVEKLNSVGLYLYHLCAGGNLSANRLEQFGGEEAHMAVGIDVVVVVNLYGLDFLTIQVTIERYSFVAQGKVDVRGWLCGDDDVVRDILQL